MFGCFWLLFFVGEGGGGGGVIMRLNTFWKENDYKNIMQRFNYCE